MVICSSANSEKNVLNCDYMFWNNTLFYFIFLACEMKLTEFTLNPSNTVVCAVLICRKFSIDDFKSRISDTFSK